LNLIVTLTGAILLIQAVRMVLPLGNAGKYVSFVLGLFFMTVVLDSVGVLDFRGEEIFSDHISQTETEQLQILQQEQIFDRYEKQLTDDIRKSVPQLQEEEFSFTFATEPFGLVQSLTITSHRTEQESAVQKISELYGIPREVIVWERK